MNADEIRSVYLDFMVEQGHVIIPRAPLVPKDDPTTLFTGSGMQPLLPYLLGARHPQGTRLTDSQTCLRVQDIEDVGDNRHTTFFEMLGNWSLGDYFKDHQLRQFWTFITERIGSTRTASTSRASSATRQTASRKTPRRRTSGPNCSPRRASRPTGPRSTPRRTRRP